jgi:phosphatidylethanolamine-binding protein (PEBP) family uncharacterized protein
MERTSDAASGFKSALLIGGILTSCAAPTATKPQPEMEGRTISGMELTSPAFLDGTPIPAQYTCDGEDRSPPLRIAGAPEGTRSFALISDDPDAPMGTLRPGSSRRSASYGRQAGQAWVHWILWNIPPETTETAESAVPAGAMAGINGWGRTGYGGPCPPLGTHRYFFRLYALDTALSFAAPPDKRALEEAMEGHVLAEAVLIGTYKRR